MLCFFLFWSRKNCYRHCHLEMWHDVKCVSVQKSRISDLSKYLIEGVVQNYTSMFINKDVIMNHLVMQFLCHLVELSGPFPNVVLDWKSSRYRWQNLIGKVIFLAIGSNCLDMPKKFRSWSVWLTLFTISALYHLISCHLIQPLD